MDATLITIVLLLILATALALIRARQRDKCLRAFEGYPITLAEKSGDLCWGRVQVFTTGLEITYVAPVMTPEGHLERSFIFYKDQYEAMHALYRYPEGLPADEQARRARIIERTARPGFWRRRMRQLRNWLGMVRDALVQAVSVLIGTAKARSPGTAVLSSQEAQFTSLSNEIIGHVGNAYDPLLETHLFSRVVVEVTRKERKFSYCGWLKDYTSRFVEIVDAVANTTQAPLPLAGYAPGEAQPEHLAIRVEGARLVVTNEGGQLMYVHRLEAGAWSRPMGCLLPPAFTADLMLLPDIDPDALRVWIGTVARFDVVVPRTHALIRHAADAAAWTEAAGRIEAPAHEALPASTHFQAPNLK